MIDPTEIQDDGPQGCLWTFVLAVVVWALIFLIWRYVRH